jgi:hypothetical protein
VGRRCEFRVRQTFEPTRLRTETLRLAYDLVAPVRRVVIVRAEESAVTDQEVEPQQESSRGERRQQDGR